MDSKWTKGPWHMGGKGSARDTMIDGEPRIWASDDAAVATIATRRNMFGPNGPSEEMICNGALIATAPEMAKLLERIAVMSCRAQCK